jgi:hypothetical protein
VQSIGWGIRFQNCKSSTSHSRSAESSACSVFGALGVDRCHRASPVSRSASSCAHLLTPVTKDCPAGWWAPSGAGIAVAMRRQLRTFIGPRAIPPPVREHKTAVWPQEHTKSAALPPLPDIARATTRSRLAWRLRRTGRVAGDHLCQLGPKIVAKPVFFAR